MMKPVAWQYRAHEDSKWCIIDGPDSLLADQLRSQGGEVRKLYAIPEGYVLVPVELTNVTSLAMRDYMSSLVIRDFTSHREVEWRWNDLIKLAQEESEC